MRKYFRSLKPFAGLLVLTVILLAVQAVTELLMPDFMSNIVNVGIQQGGFETGMPQALTEDSARLMTFFMTDEQKSEFDAAYQEKSESDGKKVYAVRGDLSEEEISSLDQSFGVAEWTMIECLREMPGGSDIMNTDSVTSGETDISDIDLDAFVKIMPALEQLPQSSVDAAREKAVKIPDTMREQTAAAFARLLSRQAGVDTDTIQSNYLGATGAKMLVVALIAAVASILVGFLSARIGAGAAKQMRSRVFQQVEGFSPQEINQFSTASLITRCTNDITQIQQFTVMGIRMLFFSPIMGVGGIILALQKSTSMAWIIAVAVLVLLGVVSVGFSVALPKFKSIQKLVDKLNLVARENLTGLLVVRAFRTQNYEEDRFNKSSYELGKTMLFTNRVMVMMMPIMMLVMNLMCLAIVWIGAQQVEQSALQIGDIMAYIQYSMIIIMSFLMIAAMFIMLPRASVSIDRIYEVLDTKPVIIPPTDPKPFIKEDMGIVEFDHVDFEYAGAEEPVLKDISFKAVPGKVTAIIGATGSGKSTLINLIPRFYDATKGTVKVSGIDVREADLADLRDEIGFVPQKGVLFSGTIASNLRYGREVADDAELTQAAEIAQAMEFINSKSDGLNTHVSEGGANVSGGQKQRLAIARALVKKAPIYIFDDSFSALDAKTDARLRRELGPYTKNSTVIIVAQKISSILGADQILVLEEGRIVGKGTHAELMKSCDAYIEIAKSQLGEEAA